VVETTKRWPAGKPVASRMIISWAIGLMEDKR
jgi:hypothetical protein